jgi:glycerophosphoryl diester phosphodiesterase
VAEQNIPYLIAHRGYPVRYPENSLAGIVAAVQAGACFVEIDVQLSACRTPFLCHDDHLERLTASDLWLTELEDEIINTLAVPYPGLDFTGVSKTEPLSSLLVFCQQLQAWPWVTAFVEIKSESIAKFGLTITIQAILEVIHPFARQCILISFDSQAVAFARKQGAERIGWVIPRWDSKQAVIAKQLAPDYLFCSTKRLPYRQKERWQGAWQWVVYTVNDERTALKYADEGILMIETDTIGSLLQHPILKKHACIQSL